VPVEFGLLSPELTWQPVGINYLSSEVIPVVMIFDDPNP
jgi:hypothetical protein